MNLYWIGLIQGLIFGMSLPIIIIGLKFALGREEE